MRRSLPRHGHRLADEVRGRGGVKWAVLILQGVGIVFAWVLQTLFILWLYGMLSGAFFVSKPGHPATEAFERFVLLIPPFSFVINALIFYYFIGGRRRRDS